MIATLPRLVLASILFGASVASQFHLARPIVETKPSYSTHPAAYTFERLNKNDSMLLVVDHQLGLFQQVRDIGPEEYRNNILAHAAIGVVFSLPTILTTSAEAGEFETEILSP